MDGWSGLVATWDWGSVPDWVAAVATPLALLAFVLELARSRRDRRTAEDAETQRAEREHHAEVEEQVRRVTAWPTVAASNGKYSDVVAYIENSSEMAIFALSVTLRSSDGNFVSPDLRTIPVVQPRGRSDEAAWHAAKVPQDAILGVVVEFTDARGQRWRRSGAKFSSLSGTAQSSVKAC